MSDITVTNGTETRQLPATTFAAPAPSPLKPGDFYDEREAFSHPGPGKYARIFGTAWGHLRHFAPGAVVALYPGTEFGAPAEVVQVVENPAFAAEPPAAAVTVKSFEDFAAGRHGGDL